MPAQKACARRNPSGGKRMSSSNRPLHELLKAETALLHEQCEKLPFFGALHSGSLPKIPIVSFLRSLAIIHAVLEKCLSMVSHHDVSELYGLTLPKVPLLVADFAALDAPASLPSITPAIRCALDYADEILTGAEDPLKLIGPLYVLEGSQKGALALKHEYARCLNTSIEQLSYFGCYASEAAMRWKAFVRRLDTISLKDDQPALVVASAVRCFECISRICAALHPHRGEDLRHHVVGINFEAGDHVMPQNPLEIDLALRVAKVAWEEYPYLKHRYGERGRRFTYSDGCWLVALTRAPEQAAVTKSLKWLRTLLASRGIPTVILEFHLHAIQRAIGAEFPDQLDMAIQFDPFLSDRRAERSSLFGAQGHRT